MNALVTGGAYFNAVGWLKLTMHRIQKKTEHDILNYTDL